MTAPSPGAVLSPLRVAAGVALIAALAVVLLWLQGRFERSDVRKGIVAAMSHRPGAGGPSVFEALVARGEGDPRCDGEVVSTLLGDVRVRCDTPARAGDPYVFRVLLDGKRAPRPEGERAERLFAELAR